jgi:hypothetical protein
LYSLVFGPAAAVVAAVERVVGAVVAGDFQFVGLSQDNFGMTLTHCGEDDNGFQTS